MILESSMQQIEETTEENVCHFECNFCGPLCGATHVPDDVHKMGGTLGNLCTGCGRLRCADCVNFTSKGVVEGMYAHIHDCEHQLFHVIYWSIV